MVFMAWQKIIEFLKVHNSEAKKEEKKKRQKIGNK